MGLMDKVKHQAEQAIAKAQQGVSQGQAKIDQLQAKRQADALLRNLGAAYYTKERSSGTQDAVDAAMKMLDEHVAAHGPLDTSATSDPDADNGAASPPATPSAPTPPAPTTGSAPPAGNFSIEDV